MSIVVDYETGEILTDFEQDEQLALASVDNIRRALEEATDIREVLEIHGISKAAVAFYLAKNDRENTQKAKIAELWSERKAGEFLKVMPKNEGGRPITSSTMEPVLFDNTPTLSDLDIDKHESHRWQILAELPEERIQEYIDEKLSKGHELTTGGLVKIAQNERTKMERKNLEEREIEIPGGRLGNWPLGYVSCIDAIEGLRGLPDESIHLIFTDPPYNLGKDYGDGIDDNKDDYLGWCDRWLQEAARVLVPGGALYVMQYPEVAAKWMFLLEGMLDFRRWITWHYNVNIGHSEDNWRRAQRTILYYTKGKVRHFDGQADPQPYKNPNDKRVKELSPDGTTPYDVWYFDLVKNVSKEKTVWENQLPVGLLERIIKVSSRPGDVVCDPFMGSGTTALAAQRNQREWIGFDVNPASGGQTDVRIKRDA